ncbi:Uncharacterised protein g1199 [Pycnogonum litorale]
MALTNILNRRILLCASVTLIGLASYSILSFVAISVFQDVFASTADRRISELDAIGIPATKRTVGDVRFLMYNRIPKCGSTTFIMLLKRLNRRNGYHHFSSDVYHRRRLSIGEQELFVRQVKNMEKPLSVDRHIFFVNFTKFNETLPIYMNIVRDPVDRLISRFYYLRAHLLKRANKDPKLRPNQSWLNLTFDECIKSSMEECQMRPGMVMMHMLMIPFFCGHDRMCSQVGNRWAYETAKNNIKRYFPVVGVLEDIEKTLAVLENYVPFFFAGAREVYTETNLHGNANGRKIPVDENVKEMVKKNLTLEYELYEFIKRRLDKQFEMIPKIRS